MKKDTISEWQQLGTVLEEMVTSLPSEITLEQLDEHVAAVRNLKREDVRKVRYRGDYRLHSAKMAACPFYYE